MDELQFQQRSKIAKILGVKNVRPIMKQMVVWVDRLIPGAFWVDCYNVGRLLFIRGPVENRPVRINNLAAANIAECAPPTRFGSAPVGCNSEDPVFQTACDHRVGTMREDQVGRVADDIRSQKGEGAGRLWEDPVKTDHHPNGGLQIFAV